jgi:hypothetical protein
MARRLAASQFIPGEYRTTTTHAGLTGIEVSAGSLSGGAVSAWNFCVLQRIVFQGRAEPILQSGNALTGGLNRASRAQAFANGIQDKRNLASDLLRHDDLLELLSTQ